MTASPAAPTHVTFTESAAGSLRLALRALGRDEQVLALADDLSFGRLDPGDPEHRSKLEIHGTDPDDPHGLEDHIARFWNQACAVRSEIVAWISRRYATEYCGFLELLWRVKDVRVSVVDVADLAFTKADGSPTPKTAQAFSIVPDIQIVKMNLRESARRITEQERDAYVTQWRKLREENAELRVLTDAGLVSAPIGYIDDVLLSCISDDWQRGATVVGSAVARLCEGEFRQCCKDILLFERLIGLVERNEIEGETEGEEWSFSRSKFRRRTPH
jgi:hypothetical protein